MWAERLKVHGLSLKQAKVLEELKEGSKEASKFRDLYDEDPSDENRSDLWHVLHCLATTVKDFLGEEEQDESLRTERQAEEGSG